MNLLERWTLCGIRLRADLGDDVFGSWFGSLKLEGIADRQARFSVSTRFLKTWIEAHYIDCILATLNGSVGDVDSLAFAVRSSVPYKSRMAPSEGLVHAKAAAPRELDGDAQQTQSFPTIALAASDLALDAPAPPVLSGSPLDRRLVFSSFVVGLSNRLAYDAANRIASAAPPIFNPLYIYSAVGLGKTHLLQSIAHSTNRQGRRAIYLTAEKFMYSFVAALKARTAITFKDNLRSIDLLLFDDAQFLQGKTIQAEFCHTLDILVDAGCQVVVAADRRPADLDALEERVRSRLAAGLCVEIEGLDNDLRVKILSTRIAELQVNLPSFEVSPGVLALVARTIHSNGRDLDGAINRLLACATLTGAALTIETAEMAIRDLVRSHESKRIKIDDIQKLVANHYNVTRLDIISSRRTKIVVKPRQIAMYLAKKLTVRSLPEIGRQFGGRDHTTVLHAVRKIEGLAGNDRSLSRDLGLLKSTLMN